MGIMVACFQLVNFINPETVNVHRMSCETNIPEHMQDMLERAKENLTSDQHKTLSKLLLEHSDVFAQNEFDSGSFTHIEHKIDTVAANPLKCICVEPLLAS